MGTYYNRGAKYNVPVCHSQPGVVELKPVLHRLIIDIEERRKFRASVLDWMKQHNPQFFHTLQESRSSELSAASLLSSGGSDTRFGAASSERDGQHKSHQNRLGLAVEEIEESTPLTPNTIADLGCLRREGFFFTPPSITEEGVGGEVS